MPTNSLQSGLKGFLSSSIDHSTLLVKAMQVIIFGQFVHLH